MITFNSIEEVKPYYNEKTNTYEFKEDGLLLDVDFNFHLTIDSHIFARNINAWDIKARNIKAWNIDVWNINAWNIDARDINAQDINARNIKARDINAVNINAEDIKARDINAWNIDAGNILYYAVCFAYKNITCSSIEGDRENSKHFALDGEITIKPKER